MTEGTFDEPVKQKEKTKEDVMIDSMIKKRDQMNARIQKAKSKGSLKARKQNTVAKILLGQAVLSLLKARDERDSKLYGRCRDTLTDKDKIRLDEALGKPAVTVKLRGEDPQ